MRCSKESDTLKSDKGNGARPSVDSGRPIRGNTGAAGAWKRQTRDVNGKRSPPRSGLQSKMKRRESPIVQTGNEEKEMERATSTTTDPTVIDRVKRKKQKQLRGPVTRIRAVHNVRLVESEVEEEGETEREPKRRRSRGIYVGFVDERSKENAVKRWLGRNKKRGNTRNSKEPTSETPQDDVNPSGGIRDRKKGPVSFQAAVRRGSGEKREGKETYGTISLLLRKERPKWKSPGMQNNARALFLAQAGLCSEESRIWIG